MEFENKYVTIKYKTHKELNEKMNKLNSEGWEVVSVSNKEGDDHKTQKSAEILLKKMKESSDSIGNKQILND